MKPRRPSVWIPVLVSLASSTLIPRAGAQISIRELAYEFAGQGLPDARGAIYVRLENPYGDGLHPTFDFQPTGGAWLLPATNERPARVIVEQCRVYEIDPRAPTNDPLRWRTLPSWKPADEIADAKAMIQALEDPPSNTLSIRFRKGFGDYSFSDNKGHSIGFETLFAAHLFNRGETNLAQRLWEQLAKEHQGIIGDAEDVRRTFTSWGTEQPLIERYENAVASLRDRGDWKSFANELDQLARQADGKTHLAETFRRTSVMAAARATNAVPESVWRHLPKSDQKLLRRLADTVIKPPTDDWPRSPVWTMGEQLNEVSPEIGAILKRGVDAIPLLCSVLHDKTLIRVSSYDWNAWFNDEHFLQAIDNREEFEGYFETSKWLPFLLTRGELARNLLMAVVPDNGLDPSNVTPAKWDEELADSAMRFWRMNRTKSRRELACFYDSSGDGFLREAAHQFFIADYSPKKPQDWSGDCSLDAMHYEELAPHLAIHKGSDAIPFLNHLKTAWTNEVRDKEQTLSNAFAIAQMSAPDKVLREAVKDNRLCPVVAKALAQALHRYDIESGIAFVVGAAASATNPATRINILAILNDDDFYQYYQPCDFFNYGYLRTPRGIATPSRPKNGKQWQALLGDQRGAWADGSWKKVGDFAYDVIRQLYGHTRGYPPPTIPQFAQEWAEFATTIQFDNGFKVDLPGYRKYIEISRARREELVTMLTNKLLTVSVCNALDPLEARWLKELRWEEFKKMAMPIPDPPPRIARVDDEIASEDSRALAGWVGQSLSREIEVAAYAYLERHPDHGFCFFNQKNNGGVLVRLYDRRAPDAWSDAMLWSSGAMESNAMARLMINTPGVAHILPPETLTP